MQTRPLGLCRGQSMEGAAGKILGTGMAPAVDYNETTRATTKGLASNEQPPQHIMAVHGEKVRRTGEI